MCEVNLIHLRSGLRGETIGAELVRSHQQYWCVRVPDTEQIKLFPNGITVYGSYEKPDGIYAISALVVGSSGDLLLMQLESTPKKKCRRSSPRYRCNLPMVLHLPTGDVEAICNDISFGGLRLTIKVSVSVPVKFELSLQHRPERPPILLDATVAWTAKSEGEQPPIRLGVRFYIADRILKQEFMQMLRDLVPESAPPMAVRAGTKPGMRVFKAIDTPLVP